MNAPVKPTAEAPPLWSLADLYAGREDPQLEADLAEARRSSVDLSALQGRRRIVIDDQDRLVHQKAPTPNWTLAIRGRGSLCLPDTGGR